MITAPSRARELIQKFNDCQWRTTRLEIIRELGLCREDRSLEFLFRLCRNRTDDLPFIEAALRALGHTHLPMAARFLTAFYEGCPAPLRAAVVSALSQVPDRTLATRFLKELPLALSEGNPSWTKALVLALGELKVHAALPLLENLARARHSDRTIALSALVSIGKLSRDPEKIADLEPAFASDAFEEQLFRGVLAQVRFRSEWKLEDYLKKSFQSPEIHRALPLELNHFRPEDVRAGLELFDAPENAERLALALSGIDHPEIGKWTFDLLKLGAQPSQAVKLLALKSLSQHHRPELRATLEKIKDRQILGPWLEAVCLAVPDADTLLKDEIESKEFAQLPESERMAAWNALANLALANQTVPVRMQNITRIAERGLETEKSPAIQGRILRLLGSVGWSSPALKSWLKAHAASHAESALYWAEHCPGKIAVAVIEPLAETDVSRVALLRAASAQEETPKNTARVLTLVKAALFGADDEIQAALRFLSRHPLPELLSQVTSALTGPHALEAVVALRAYAQPDTADATAKLLDSPNEALAGRALDTLTALPGMRAKRLAIDYLKAHPDHVEACEKIARCLEPPESGADYFVAAVDSALEAFPDHPLLDGLLAFRERLRAAADAQHSATQGTALKGADTVALDRALTSRIPSFASLDASAQSALRSAELPFVHPELYDDFVDKSASVLEYTKAIDIVLEQGLGKRILFPKLERSLSDFQNILHAVGLHEPYPSAELVMRNLGLEKQFSPQSFPLHKMSLIAQAFLNGKILNERFKVMDGLRAWAVVLLVFGRKLGGAGGVAPFKPVLALSGKSGAAPGDDVILKLCKKLIGLQEIRNPAAHRQTLAKLVALDDVRSEAITVLQTLDIILNY